MGGPRRKIIALERQPQRRDLVGGKRERNAEDSHKRGFPKNLSDHGRAAVISRLD
jgi:hypothetical protein